MKVATLQLPVNISQFTFIFQLLFIKQSQRNVLQWQMANANLMFNGKCKMLIASEGGCS